MQTLAGFNRGRLIDLLLERLAFERKSVELYEFILAKASVSNDPAAQRLVPAFRETRDQEKEHAEWLEGQIRALGGDSEGESDLSRLVERESSGVLEVVRAETELSHLLHALLTAELADNMGWELLVRLAAAAEDEEARRAFARRRHEEEEHVELVQRALAQLTRQEILGNAMQWS